MDECKPLHMGQHDEFAHMIGECYSTKIEKYEYKVCPFADAKQDHTRLGTMAPLSKDQPRYGSLNVACRVITCRSRQGPVKWPHNSPVKRGYVYILGGYMGGIRGGISGVSPQI